MSAGKTVFTIGSFIKCSPQLEMVEPPRITEANFLKLLKILNGNPKTLVKPLSVPRRIKYTHSEQRMMVCSDV